MSSHQQKRVLISLENEANLCLQYCKYILFICNIEIMEQTQFVQIEFVQPLKKQKHIKQKPINVDDLFKKIKYQAQKQKEKKIIKNKSTDIYDRIALALQKKIGSTKTKGYEAQTQVQDLIHLCRQQRHIRSRNYSAKPITNKQHSDSTKKTCKRPQTCRPMIQRSKSNILSQNNQRKNKNWRPKSGRSLSGKSKISSKQYNNYSNITYSQKNQDIYSSNKAEIEKNGLKIKKKADINYEKLKNVKQQFDEKHKKDQKQNINPQYRPYGRAKCTKNRQKIDTRLGIQNSVKCIINKCDATKKQINIIGKKVQFFQYYGDRLTKNLEKVQKFLPQKSDLDDLYQ